LASELSALFHFGTALRPIHKFLKPAHLNTIEAWKQQPNFTCGGHPASGQTLQMQEQYPWKITQTKNQLP
jgi:hypothetical protein